MYLLFWEITKLIIAAGGSDSSTIPTIGDVLRFAKDSNEPGSVGANKNNANNSKITPQLLQEGKFNFFFSKQIFCSFLVAMKAQILQLQKNKQIQQKSNQILAAAAAAAGIKTGSTSAALAQGRTLNVNFFLKYFYYYIYNSDLIAELTNGNKVSGNKFWFIFWNILFNSFRN